MEFHSRYDGFYGAFVHDPFAVAAALDPSLVRTEALPVDVELDGTLTTGETVTDWRRARVASATASAECPTPDVPRASSLGSDDRPACEPTVGKHACWRGSHRLNRPARRAPRRAR